MTSRREVIQKLFKGAALAGTGGLIWSTATGKHKSEELVLRPPGAISKEKFLKACIKCGQCVDACPYDTLKLAQPEDKILIGTPYFTPRETPCYMCTNYPCTEVCPSGALDLKKLTRRETGTSIDHAEMGLAVVHRESCIAFWGIQCDACYRACPLMEKAIVLDFKKNTKTGKHANLQPVVMSDACTGCGACEHACVTEKAAIRVLPREIAIGEVGDHYIKSWEENDEERINNIQETGTEKDTDVETALDYLNKDEELFD